MPIKFFTKTHQCKAPLPHTYKLAYKAVRAEREGMGSRRIDRRYGGDLSLYINSYIHTNETPFNSELL